MIEKYRKKPVVIEAVKWDGKNLRELEKFVGDKLESSIDIHNAVNVDIWINTLEGRMFADRGDYIIKGVNGEFYPCKPDVFNKTYEKVF